MRPALPSEPPAPVDPSRSQSPPLQSSYAQYELPQKPTSHSQRPPSSRKHTRSPDPRRRVSTNAQPPAQPSSSSHHQHGRDARERLPESSSNRHATKPPRHQSRTEPTSAPPPATTKPQPIPFPARQDYLQPYEASPMSTLSMLANPPTPYDLREVILTPDQSPPPSLPPKSIYEGREGKKAPAHNPSPIRTSAVGPAPANPSPSRQNGDVQARTQLVGERVRVRADDNRRRASSGRSSRPSKPRPARRKRRRLRGRRTASSRRRATAIAMRTGRSREQERRSRDYDARERRRRRGSCGRRSTTARPERKSREADAARGT